MPDGHRLTALHAITLADAADEPWILGLARLHDWPVVRLPLHGRPTPARRILAATRRGRHDHPVVARSLETIGATAATLLPSPLSR